MVQKENWQIWGQLDEDKIMSKKFVLCLLIDMDLNKNKLKEKI